VSAVQEVIRVRREFKCCAGFSCFAGIETCALEVSVEAPVGEVIGYVRQQSVRQSFLIILIISLQSLDMVSTVQARRA